MLTRALLRSDPTDKLLLCHSSSAWHGAARIWVQTKRTIENEMGEMSCLCQMLLGSSQRNKIKTYIVGTVYKSHNSE